MAVHRLSLLLALGFAAPLLDFQAHGDLIYVGDAGANAGNGAVYEYNSSGTLVNTLTDPTFFYSIASVAVDSSGNVYVGTINDGKVVKFSPSGADLGVIITGFVGLRDLAFDQAGNLCICGGSTIKEYNTSGTYLQTIVSSGLSQANGMAIDSSGNFYVSDFGNNSIEKFSSTGQSLGVFASNLNSYPAKLAFDPSGNLWVPNLEGNQSVEEFSPGGTLLKTLPQNESSPAPGAVAFDSSGALYVVDEGLNGPNARIEKYTPGGTTDLGVFNQSPVSGPNSIAIVPSAIPEPSAACLGAFGALALTWRRRNRPGRRISLR